GATLTGLDPDLVTALTAPSTERFSRFSALTRFDAQRGSSTRVFVRGSVGYAKRDFDGLGLVSASGDAALPEETVEFGLAGAWLSEVRPRMTLEVRAGLSGSSRDFRQEGGLPAAYLTGSGSVLGGLPGGSDESSRLDFMVLPIVRYALDVGT